MSQDSAAIDRAVQRHTQALTALDQGDLERARSC
jgi:hypothetical protein